MSTDLLEIQRLDVAVDQLRHRRVHLEQRTALDAALDDQRTQQAAIDDVGLARVGEELIARAVALAADFELQVNAVGGERVGVDVEARHHVQHRERDDALAVGRALVDREAAIVG